MGPEDLILPAIITIITSSLTYYWGSRKARRDLLDKRQLEVAEELGVLVQELFDSHKYIYGTLKQNESKMGLEKLVENFEKYAGSLYLEVRNSITASYEAESRVNDKLRIVRLFVRGKLPNPAISRSWVI